MNTDTPTPSIIDHPSSYLARIAELERELAEAKETLASEGRQFTAYQSAAREAHNHHLSVVKERDDLREELDALNGAHDALRDAAKNAYERMTNAEMDTRRLRDNLVITKEEVNRLRQEKLSAEHCLDASNQARADIGEERETLKKQLTAWREDARKLAMRLQSFGLRLTEVDKEALIAHERLLNLAPDAPVHSPPTPAA